jgi:Rhs element Vgr protein
LAPNTDYSRVLGLESLPLQHIGAFSGEEAQAWAAAQMTKSELAKNRGRVKFDGVADIKPGDCISLQGVGKRHSGKVFVTAVVHEIGDGMWYTHAQFGLSQRWFAQEFEDVTDQPASSLLPAIHGLQIGIVTQINGSPSDTEFRIQVRLPMVNPQGDGLWTRLATQDAGNNRGAVWRPEIGDEVVVGFFNDDPRQAVVLGCLHSSKNPAPIPADDKNHEKGWVTRSNMKMVFNDDEKSIVIETPKGKKVTIDEKSDKILLEDQHKNKIVMDKNGIVIESSKDLTLKAAKDVKMEGTNIQQKAQATYKAESQGQAQLQATADMVIKGTFVRIN